MKLQKILVPIDVEESHPDLMVVGLRGTSVVGRTANGCHGLGR